MVRGEGLVVIGGSFVHQARLTENKATPNYKRIKSTKWPTDLFCNVLHFCLRVSVDRKISN